MPTLPHDRRTALIVLGGAMLAGRAWASGAVASYRWPEGASPQAAQLVRWALQSGDAQGVPFAIVDKPDARLHVFDATGRWLGSAPVLLGSALGDTSAPGIGDKPLARIRPEERTTPAGRFASEPGRNTRGDDLVWIDYDAAVSLHRIRSVHPRERRQERLASPLASERRISNGCVNVANAFYDRVVAPTLGQTPGVVYVVPDTVPFATIFIAASAY
ncbi:MULTISPECIES: hypothetical protein [unclassified Acidovorax]|uniref:hypothetical protein n=1 Tax=unclassified Acidovorax TaxID=2684926 RepID=UPI0038576DFC